MLEYRHERLNKGEIFELMLQLSIVVLIVEDVLLRLLLLFFDYGFVILIQSLMDFSHSFDCPSCNCLAYVICCFSMFIILDLFNCHVLMIRGVFVSLIRHSLTNYILLIDLV